MTPDSRYPLAALERLRRRLVDEARAELADAMAEGGRARRRADDAQRALQSAVERRRAAERAGAEGTAAALEAQARWVARLRRDESALGGELARLREESTRWAAREDRRRGLLAEAERQHRTVERHRELWEAERRRAATRAEEAEQEDRALARVGQRPT